MKTDYPCYNSGKTHFNRIKSKDQSWIALRDEAIRSGSWYRRQPIVVDNNEDDCYKSTRT
jgi:hypothetical protein